MKLQELSLILTLICLLLIGYLLNVNNNNNELLVDNTPEKSELINDRLELLDNGHTGLAFSQQDAISILQAHSYVSSQMNFTETQTLLFRDNQLNRVYWSITDGENTSHVDGFSGEVFYYSTLEWTDGSITENGIKTIASDYANQFLGTDGCTLRYKWDAGDSYYDPINNNTYKQGLHKVLFIRTHNGYETSDGSELWLDPSGNLVFYQYTWTLDISSNLEVIISESEAYSIGLSKLSINRTVTQSEIIASKLVICEPNYFWDNEGPLYGDYRGILNYLIVIEFQAEYPNYGKISGFGIFNIDAQTGNVIGGDLEEWKSG